MAKNTANLDALILRDDFLSQPTQAGGNPRQTISISDLDQASFFRNSLRKPDFQRETTHWTPPAVVDLIRAFLDGDLIPAVILWERGDENFVIDGAHRLSALIAWICDDYGDGSASNMLFGSGLTDVQRKVADRTRKLVKNEIGTYAEFSGLLGKPVSDPQKARRLHAMGKNAIVIQWVTAATAKAAENSFFKINQAAQPIDPIERRILQSRTSPNAIAARCIARAGQGHKYWAEFSSERRERIEELGAHIYDILFKPPHSQPITSSDLPIAGQGYNALPFVFDLVMISNGLKLPNSAKNRRLDEPLPSDVDGQETITFLETVRSRLLLVSTNDSGSLGFHPLVYYYARSGTFLPIAFLASLEFAEKLDREGRKDDFTRIRRQFEEYVHNNKLFVSLTVSRLGSGARSLYRIVDLYWSIFEGLHQRLTEDDLFDALVARSEFVHLSQTQIPPPSAELPPSKHGATRQTKSAAFIREALQNSVRCYICDSAIHSNAVTFDHVERKRAGGDNRDDNLMPSHPYCNSGFKN